MKFGPTNHRSCARKSAAAFTLAEVLAALLFMAIVIPVAVQGLQIANSAGVVAQRKAAAARIADRMLNELMVTGTWQQNNQHGSVWDDFVEYRWSLEERNWEPGTLRLLTLEVRFEVQGRELALQLNTLADPSAGLTTSTNQTGSATSTGGTSR